MQGLHNHSKAVSMGSLTLGMLTTVLSVAYSAVRAGSSTTLLSLPNSPSAASEPLLQFDNGAGGQEEGRGKASLLLLLFYLPPYLLSLACTLRSFLPDGRPLLGTGKLVDVDHYRVGYCLSLHLVRIITELGTACLFIWSLVAPILFPDREF